MKTNNKITKKKQTNNMIGYVEMISDKERAALNEALKQSGEEDLNNTLQLVD